MKISSGVKREDNSTSPLIARHRVIEVVSGPKLIGNCFSAFSELFFGVIADVRTEGPSDAPLPCSNPTSKGSSSSFFGNHPFFSGFHRRIFSRAIGAISATEKDGDKPSSRFLHIIRSVCTSYAAVCSPYALFCQSRKANKE